MTHPALLIADDISDNLYFRMDHIIYSCGTPACIYGHVAARYDLDPEGKEDDHMARAAQLLGAKAVDFIPLFYPNFTDAHCNAEPGDPAFISATHAIAMLKNLAATGEVDWTNTRPAAETVAEYTPDEAA